MDEDESFSSVLTFLFFSVRKSSLPTFSIPELVIMMIWHSWCSWWFLRWLLTEIFPPASQVSQPMHQNFSYFLPFSPNCVRSGFFLGLSASPAESGCFLLAASNVEVWAGVDMGNPVALAGMGPGPCVMCLLKYSWNFEFLTLLFAATGGTLTCGAEGVCCGSCFISDFTAFWGYLLMGVVLLNVLLKLTSALTFAVVHRGDSTRGW